MTKSNENVLTLACWYGYDYFPTHNGVDSLDEIECIDGKWSLPDDMAPIQCKSVTCPPFPDFGSKIVTKCTKRDKHVLQVENMKLSKIAVAWKQFLHADQNL